MTCSFDSSQPRKAEEMTYIINELSRNWKKILNRENKEKKQEKMNIFNYYPHQIEKNNCLGETELASGKTLKSREIIHKDVFLAECVECAINV